MPDGTACFNGQIVIQQTFQISPQHPCLAGHFPGNPLVPGVIIVDEVMQCIQRQWAGTNVQTLPSIKFLSPLRPGIEVKVEIVEKKAGLLSFTCHTSETLICSGQVLIHD